MFKKGYPAYIWFLFLFNVGLAAIVLILDLRSDSLVSFAPLYSLVVLFSWILPRKLTIALVIICVGLTIYSTIKDVQRFDQLHEIMLNGFLGLTSVLITYFLVMLTQNSVDELKKTNEHLNSEIENRTEELQSKVNDLESHKSLLEESKDLLTTMQSELRKSELKYQLMIEKIQDYAVVLLDKNGNIATWNSGAETIWKYNAQEVLGKSFYFLMSRELNIDLPDHLQILKTALTKGTTFLEGFRKTKGGQLIYTTDNFSVIENENDNEIVGYTWITHDRTEKKRHEDEIVQLNKSLELKVQERTKDLESFVYSVSHDLRAPLRAVNGFSQILKEEIKAIEGSDNIDRYVNFIVDNGNKMNQLIEDLLRFSRMGNKKLMIEDIDMNELVDEVHDEILVQFPEYKSHEFKITKPLPHVAADRSLIKQVVVNYLSNAHKYSAKEESPKISVEFDQHNEFFEFCIRDNGAGFDEKYGEKLFQVFQRLHDGSEFEGNGIGLAMVKRIIQNHGGTVTGKGILNEGAQFYFSLPVERTGVQA